MKASDFWRAVIAGFFAAYLMGLVSGWERGLGGVPSPQSLGLLATSPTIPFDFYINGIVLALIYAKWIHGCFNWHPLILANLYSLALVFVAMGILVPLLDPGVGFFAIKTGDALKFTMGHIIARVAFGTVLALFYLPEETR